MDGPKVMFKFLWKHTKPYSGTLGFITLAHVTASAFITYFEMRNNLVLRRKIMEIEDTIDSNGEK